MLHAWTSADPTQTGAFVTDLDAPESATAVCRGHTVSSVLFTEQ
jgi:hypothetical protein